jgi:hypothetical protein
MIVKTDVELVKLLRNSGTNEEVKHILEFSIALLPVIPLCHTRD